MVWVARQIDRVAIEIQQIQTAIVAVAGLPVAVLHNHAQAPVGHHQRPTLGDHGDGLRGVAGVVHQNAFKLAGATPLTHKKGHIACDRREHTLAQQGVGVVVADRELHFLKRAVAQRLQIDRHAIAGDDGQHANQKGRPRQFRRAKAGRRHDHQFPVAGQAVVDEQHRRETRDRQDQRQPCRQQQHGQLQERPQR